jgi:mono/diheme cytochrome c family protein
MTRRLSIWATAFATLLYLGCSPEIIELKAPPSVSPMGFPGLGAAKADVFGRALAGVAAPYNADLSLSADEDRLKSDMGYRRKVAWDVVMRVLDPVPLLGLADATAGGDEIALPNGEVPRVPRFQTWYGVDDFKRMFRHLFEGLTPAERAQRAPFTDKALEEAVEWNAAALDRSERWPLDRFLKYVSELGVCAPGTPDDQCARSLQSNFSGATSGNARITYSPGTMKHLLKNYGTMLACLETLKTMGLDAVPTDEDQNFTACFSQEFPANAALIKAHWVRADFGRTMPVFDTSGPALESKIGTSMSADWADGDREADPTPDKVFMIRLKNGDIYRLAGLHIMTKELRHWVWITLWWSDTPNEDFGADRPAEFKSKVSSVWSNYKMGVVVDYKEHDPNPTQWFNDQPTLAAALQAVSNTESVTWLSNPYIEHGRGNARTNCIGCHQHGGSLMGPDLDGDGTADLFDLELVIDNENLFPSNGRVQIRSLFPADYLWSTQRVDNLSQVIKSDVEHFDFSDKDQPEVRAAKILQLASDVTQGDAVYQANCTTCHGNDGMGTPTAPSLFERVPPMTDQALAERLILGKPGTIMPSWAQLTDQQLADLRAYLRATFDTATP